jgi:hypothetical protein
MTIDGVSYLDDNREESSNESPAPRANAEESLPNDEEPGFLETVAAKFRNDSLLGIAYQGIQKAVYQQLSHLSNFREPEEEFNLAAALENVPEEDRKSYYWCNTELDFHIQKEFLERDRSDEDIIRRSQGFKGFAAGLAALVPDLTLGAGILPGMAAAKVASKIPQTLPRLGALAEGAAAGGTFGAEYAAAHYVFKPNYTLNDAAYSTVASMAVGAAFNVIGVSTQIAYNTRKSKIVLAELRQQQREVEKDLTETLKCDFPRFQYIKDSEVALDSMGNINAHAIADLPEWFKIIYAVSPVGQCATSPFNTMNKLGEMAFRTDTQTYATKAGIERGAAMEALIDKYKGDLLFFRKDYFDLFDRFLKSDNAKPLRKKSVNLQFFEEETRLAILRGGTHDIPEITAAARLCEDYMQRMLRLANEFEVLHIENLGGAISTSYLTANENKLSAEELLKNIAAGKSDIKSVFALHRVYDIPEVIEGKKDLIPILEKGLTKSMGREQNELIDIRIDTKLAKAQEKYEVSKEGLQNTLAYDLKLTEASLKEKLSQETKRIGDALENEQKAIRAFYDRKIEDAPKAVKTYLAQQKEGKAYVPVPKYLSDLEEKTAKYLDQSIAKYDNSINKLEKLIEGDKAHKIALAQKKFEKKGAELEEDLQARINSLEKERVTQKNEMKNREKFSEKELKAKAEKQWESLIGASDGERWSIPSIRPGSGGYDKARSINVDDELLSRWLVKSPMQIITAMHHKLVPRISIKKVLRENGYESMQDVFKELEAEYAAIGGKEGVDGAALKIAYDKATKLFPNIPLIIEGTYGSGQVINNRGVAAMVQALSHLNFARLLGGVTLSSLNDVSILENHWGVRETSGAYLREFAYKLNDIFDAKKLTPEKGVVEDLQRMGAAIEYESLRFADILNNRWYQSYRYHYGPRLDKFVNAAGWMSRKAAYLNFNNVWNDFNKTVAGRLFIDKLIRTAIKPVKTLEDKQFLANSRFPLKMCDRLKAQFERHGEFYDDLAIPNYKLWQDEELQDVFGAAVVTNSHNTVLVPGVGDVPIAFKGLPGRFLVNFKSFQFAYTNNVLTKWVSGQSTHRIASAITSVGLTALGKYLKAWAAGNPYGGADDRQLWIDTLKDNEIFTAPVNMMSQGVQIAYTGLTAGKHAAFAELAEQVPSMGFIGGVLELGYTALTRNFWETRSSTWSERDWWNVAKLLPFHTLPYVQGVIRSAIKEHVMSTGGKLSRTRMEKYEAREPLTF